jgi:hypothetical protein
MIITKKNGMVIDTSQTYECIKYHKGTVKCRETIRGHWIAKCDNPICGFEEKIKI